MAVEYQVYLKLKADQRPDLPEESRYTAFAIISNQPITVLAEAARLTYANNRSVAQAYEVVAFERYNDYLHATEDVARWGSGSAFHAARAKWLIKRDSTFAHPIKELSHIDVVFRVEGDPHIDEKRPMTLFMNHEDAVNYAMRVLGVEDVLSKIHPVVVYTM